ncbi:RHOMBOID-like protein 13 [Hondaea fermentalgiana]|uniref:RHOMBOID-like protein 13 n=1 Tax=Hondaea fermentalgiana TaxID=2315210 RepID=A0A2R5GX78_9STRA|nr:RHOMBOID-like protein 13 [Hondaea fermentalgiana]|eukprot:GBG33293.1 RHOMBOID-like protein 13 [Hondaea fermentalgiana]
MLEAADDAAWEPWWAEPSLPPVTAALVTVLIAITVFFNVLGASVDMVACSYKEVVQRREFWRVLVAPLAHKDPIHLIVSVLLVWDSRDVEQWIGPAAYARLVFHFVLIIAALHLGYAHFDSSRGPGVRPSQTWSWHGMSAVVFALLMARFVLPYLEETSQITVMSFIRVPAPCVSALVVIFYSAVAQRPVTMVHAIGTIAGVLFVVGALDWITPYLSFCALQWCCVAFVAGRGFPPTLVSDEVVAQRRIEEGFAAQVQRRRREPAQDETAQHDENASAPEDLEAGVPAGASVDDNELDYLMEMRIDIPERLRQPSRPPSEERS